MRAVPACLLCALLLGGSAVHAANWFELDGPSAASDVAALEVDTDSLGAAGSNHAVTVRVTYPEPHPHPAGGLFRSVVATVEFACEGGLTGYRGATYYAGPRGSGSAVARQEGRLAPASNGTRDLLPPRSVELLIRASCSRPATAAP
jgi:hypothetical protein